MRASNEWQIKAIHDNRTSATPIRRQMARRRYTHFEKQVVTIAIIGTLTYICCLSAGKCVAWFNDNFLYLPSVQSISTNDYQTYTLTTDNGSEYVVEPVGRP